MARGGYHGPRLCLTRDEYRYARMTEIRCFDDLRIVLGAKNLDFNDMEDMLVRDWGAGLRIREVLVPRAENWIFTFRRVAGGWATRGQQLTPFVGEVIRGINFPRYVRHVIPVNRQGLVPASLAPRHGDLPSLKIAGTWKRVPGRGSRYGPPLLETIIDAHVPGVVIHCTASRISPWPVRLPIGRDEFMVALANYAWTTSQEKRGWWLSQLPGHEADEEKRRAWGNRMVRIRRERAAERERAAQAAAQEGRQPEAVPVLPRARVLGAGDDGEGDPDGRGGEAPCGCAGGIRGDQ